MSDEYITEQGREDDIKRTRHYFSAVIAGLKTAEEYVRELRAELEAAEADRDRLAAALERIRAHANDDRFDPKRAYYAEVKQIAREALSPGATQEAG